MGIIQIFFLEYIETKYKDRDQERPEDNPHKTKQRQADDHTEYGNERMGIRHFFLQDKTNDTQWAVWKVEESLEALLALLPDARRSVVNRNFCNLLPNGER